MSGRLALVAIDEAHCISEWGHDFRPDYRRIGEVVRQLGAPRIAAFTATATPEVRRDIAHQLGLDAPELHVRGFDRPNLHYAVERVAGGDDKPDKLVELFQRLESEADHEENFRLLFRRFYWRLFRFFTRRRRRNVPRRLL